ncbi:MAG: flagellar assembly protein FliW [Chloroflexi bacterium]|nr:flagellar assembly protein FliW [Chloroflexota bacterium]
MHVQTAPNGSNDAPPQRELTIRFPAGLPGFEAHTSFVLVDVDPDETFRWLQSRIDERIAFLAVDPWLIAPEYEFELSDEDALKLGLGNEAPLVLCIVTVPENAEAATANLKAPLVVSRRSGFGKQVILSDERYSLRHPVFGGTETARAGVSRC